MKKDGSFKFGEYNADTNNVETYLGVRTHDGYIPFAHDMMFTKNWFVIIDSSVHFNRIVGTVAYMRPLKLQASLRARDLARYCALVAVGHRFEKVSVLATMPSQIYSRKLEWTSNADRLKFNGRSAVMATNLIG